MPEKIELSNALFVIGLTIDICGAWFLAQSFVLKNMRSLVWEGTSGYGSPPNTKYISSYTEQRAEAYIGFVLLTFGYILQGIDYLSLPILTGKNTSTIYVIIMAPITIAAMFVIGNACSHLLFIKFRSSAIQSIFIEMPDYSSNIEWLSKICKDFRIKHKFDIKRNPQEFIAYMHKISKYTSAQQNPARPQQNAAV